MTALKLDPLGQSILRELVEAEESMLITSQPWYEGNRFDYEEISLMEEHFEREECYDTLCEDFATYLILMGAPDIDIHVLQSRWESERKKPEDARENGKLWNAIYDACHDYIDLYKAR